MAANLDKSIFAGTSLTATHSAPAPADSQIIPETNPGAIRSLYLAGPAGRLEALLNEGHPDAPFVTLLCHPHPKGGGTMHNKVVYHVAKVFSALGWPVLRFNFRGTGLSEGAHDGRAEVDDVRTGLDWLSAHYGKPIVASGFSFGAAMGLQACCKYPGGEAGIKGFAALGLPTQAGSRRYTYPFLADCPFPKLFLSGNQDQFASFEQLQAAVSEAANPTQLVFIPDADHFFLGHLEAMQSALNQWLTGTFLPPQNPGSEKQGKATP